MAAKPEVPLGGGSDDAAVARSSASSSPAATNPLRGRAEVALLHGTAVNSGSSDVCEGGVCPRGGNEDDRMREAAELCALLAAATAATVDVDAAAPADDDVFTAASGDGLGARGHVASDGDGGAFPRVDKRLSLPPDVRTAIAKRGLGTAASAAPSPAPLALLHNALFQMKKEINDTQLVILEVLGQGGFGTVYKGIVPCSEDLGVGTFLVFVCRMSLAGERAGILIYP